MVSSITTTLIATAFNIVAWVNRICLHTPPIIKSYQALGLFTPYYSLCSRHGVRSPEQCYLALNLPSDFLCSSVYKVATVNFLKCQPDHALFLLTTFKIKFNLYIRPYKILKYGSQLMLNSCLPLFRSFDSKHTGLLTTSQACFHLRPLILSSLLRSSLKIIFLDIHIASSFLLL